MNVEDPCCLRKVREHSDLIKNILIGVPKTNKDLTGLELLDFLGELSL